MQEEQWKEIRDYEDYQVSNLGKVKSLKHGKEKVLKPTIINGYYHVGLSLNGKQKTKRVHKLVSIAFLNHNPYSHNLVVDHINNIKTDNRLENLQVVTQKFNVNKSKNNKHLAWSSKINKWILLIRYKGKQIYLGYFDNEIQASEIYAKELKKLSL